MRAFLVLAAAALSVVSVPAKAVYTVTIGPTTVYGTDVIDISGSGCDTPGGPVGSQCPGSGRSFYTGLVSGTGEATTPGSPADVIFRSFNVFRGQFDIDLIYDGTTLIGTSLIGQSQPSSGCTNSAICRTELITFSARSFAVTLTDTSTGISQILAPVPEPTTWAMMLIGFAAIGCGVRRNRRSVRSQTA